jgi:hypothetical protein
VHVLISDTNSVVPLIKIIALESKSSSADEPLEPLPWVDPFKEGCAQVAKTLSALEAVINPVGSDTLVEDLKFSSFVEHVASIVLAQLHPIRVDDQKSKAVLTNLNGFSLRTLPANAIALEGMVVCTQYAIAAPAKVLEHSFPLDGQMWPVTLARAGALEVERLLSGAPLDIRRPQPDEKQSQEPPQSKGRADSDKSQGSIPASSEPDQIQASSSDRDIPPVKQEEELKASKEDKAKSSGRAIPDAIVQQCEAIRQACYRRDFPVGDLSGSDVRVGPSVVVLSLPLKPGASIKPIESVIDDLAREAGVSSLMVENDPTTPYHIRFAFARGQREFPNLPSTRAPVVEKEANAYLGIHIGKDVNGADVISFMSAWPHMLIAGTSGSGKTTFMRALLIQLDKMPDGAVELVIIDGKGETDYLNLVGEAHLTKEFSEVLLGFDRVNEVLDWVVEKEIPRRRNVLREMAKRTKEGERLSASQEYVSTVSHGRNPPFAPLIVVVDEFNELMLSGGAGAQKFEQRIQQITQTGRSTLVHLILATQRPDVRVIRGSIKANLDSRIAMRLPTVADSITILGRKGAESLLGKGDLIFQPGGAIPLRLQGYSA